MKKGLSILSAGCISFSVLFSSCGPPLDNGKKVSKNMDITNFHAVEIDAPVTSIITIQPGATPSVQFSGSESLIKMLRVKTEDSTLDIYSDD